MLSGMQLGQLSGANSSQLSAARREMAGDDRQHLLARSLEAGAAAPPGNRGPISPVFFPTASRRAREELRSPHSRKKKATKFGGLSLSRSEGTQPRPCLRTTRLIIPNTGSQSASLIQVKMHKPDERLKLVNYKQQSRRRTQPTALPSSPIAPRSWAVVVGRRTGGEVMRAFTFVPNSSAQRKEGQSSPTRED
jgi:hypothetical protein